MMSWCGCHRSFVKDAIESPGPGERFRYTTADGIHSPGKAEEMKKLSIVSTACLVIIAAILVHQAWSQYKHRLEAEAALRHSEEVRPPRFQATVPPADESTTNPSGQIIVSVTDRGEIKLNGQEAGTTGDTDHLRAKLERFLRERAGHHPGKAVFIRAHHNLSYAEVAKVIDTAKRAGADPVGLQAEETR